MSKLRLAVALVSCSLIGGACRGKKAPSGPDEGPVAPSHGLPLAEWNVPWTLPRQVAGDLEALRSHVAKLDRATAFVSPRLTSPGREDALDRMLAQLSPQTQWDVKPSEWTQVVGEAGAPLHRVSDTPGEGPRYRAEGLRRLVSSGSAVALLDAPVDLVRWRGLPTSVAGSCEDLVHTLALDQEQSLAYLEGFLDDADARLRNRFRRELRGALPELSERVDAMPQGECKALQSRRLEGLKRCGANPAGCSMAPRVVTDDGVAIAMPRPENEDDVCEGQEFAAFEDALHEPVLAATEAVTARLDRRWVVLADRLGLLIETFHAVDDVCDARRRRIASGDLRRAIERVASIGHTLASDVLEEPGDWDVGATKALIAGVGTSTVLARYVAGAGSASTLARANAIALRRFVLSRALCQRGLGERPLAVAVFEQAQAEPSFFGYLYEEELLCADLPLPLSAPAGDGARSER